MTMFRKVFGQQMAAQAEAADRDHDDIEEAVMPMMEDTDSPSPVPRWARDLPEMRAAPKGEATPDRDAMDRSDDAEEHDDFAADLVARAAEAHKKLMDRQAPAPMTTAEVVSAPEAETAALGPDTMPGEIRHDAVPPEMSQKLEAESAPQPVPRRRAGNRARTRLLGFDPGLETHKDPFADAGTGEPDQLFPTGWIVVVDGPGRGHSFPIFSGASSVGRGEDQAIRLDFGDTAISRQNHAALAYDSEDNAFYLGHGGKSNIIRLNGRPVLATEELGHGDTIRIGETTLRFVAFCGDDFSWSDEAVG